MKLLKEEKEKLTVLKAAKKKPIKISENLKKS